MLIHPHLMRGRAASFLVSLATLVCGADVLALSRVQVPLTVPVPYLEARAGELMGVDPGLGLDEAGRARGVLSSDGCNRLEFTAPELTPEGAQLGVAVDLVAHTGLDLFGACRGPGTLSGQLRLKLVPSLDQGGRAVLFEAVGAELRREDGSSGLLTTPSRLLAEKLILPRLEALRVDIGDALANIDLLIERFLGVSDGGPSPLVERGRLAGVGVEPAGLAVDLAFALEAQQRPQGPTAGTTLGVDPESPVEAALTEAELAEWRTVEDELDGFLTEIILQLAGDTQDRDLRLELLAVLLDARLRIAEALVLDDEGEDPLRRLFLDAWAQLRPLAATLPADDTSETSGLRLAAFLAGGDALRVLDALGPEWGIEISRDGLRRFARMLMAGEAPASFTPLPLEPDDRLRDLLGFDREMPEATPTQTTPPGEPLSFLRRLSPIAPAFAEEPSPAELLRVTVPELATLDAYLNIVAQLIAEAMAQHEADSRLNDEYRDLFEPLVRATAWKETCWRHYVPRDEELVVIRSPVGAVGMMQIVGRVWRSVYDLDRLEHDVTYNVAAGIEILEHYFLDYAVRRGEHKRPGGLDNLVKATYAGYNAGPSRMSRYRREETAARAKAVDREFYRQYLAMRESPWPSASACYAR